MAILHRLFNHFIRHTRSTNPVKHLIHASSQSSLPPPPSQSTLSLISTAPQATATIAHFLASPPLHPGDCFLLHGQVGAGKSHFTRSFIRAAASNPDLPVPSPTYLLMHTYELASSLSFESSPPSSPSPLPLIHHFDLYRLTNTSELMRLDLPTSLSSAVTLIEWPDILLNSSNDNDQVPSNYIELRIALLSSDEQTQLQQQHSIDLTRDEDEAVDDEEEDWYDDDGSGDDRWRQIQITLVGEEINSATSRWKRKLDTLASYLNVGLVKQQH